MGFLFLASVTLSRHLQRGQTGPSLPQRFCSNHFSAVSLSGNIRNNSAKVIPSRLFFPGAFFERLFIRLCICWLSYIHVRRQHCVITYIIPKGFLPDLSTFLMVSAESFTLISMLPTSGSPAFTFPLSFFSMFLSGIDSRRVLTSQRAGASISAVFHFRSSATSLSLSRSAAIPTKFKTSHHSAL